METMQPDPLGYFGEYGGQYVPETLMGALEELEQAWASAAGDPGFRDELDGVLRDFVGRETPLYFAERLTQAVGGARIFLKREDLAHTGAHKINNAMGQVLLAAAMGKPRIIAETGAGQHGVATATAAARAGLECEVFMGSVDVERQRLNVERMELLGARVIAVKDIFHVEGLPTRAGSRLPAAELGGPEAESVQALKRAGGLVLGKTISTEFAYFASGPTRNPHDPRHTPGGSSSGSAAAVAAGYCPLALGTQTIGSISRPASFCGVVGYKPTYGRISTAGVIPLSPSLDHVGIFSASVPDAALSRPFCAPDGRRRSPTISQCWRFPRVLSWSALRIRAEGISRSSARRWLPRPGRFGIFRPFPTSTPSRRGIN